MGYRQEITEKIEHPNECNLCGGNVEFIENAKIYGKSYGSGKAYRCKKCYAYVGTHPVGKKDRALGILNDQRLRLKKMQCHALFDAFWKSQLYDRRELYKRLARDLDIEHWQVGSRLRTKGDSMRFLDLFSGIGGFRLAFEQAGHECVGHCEIDKFANKSYIAIHQPKENEFYAADIRTIRATLINDLKEEDRPKYIIFENVKNLLSINRGFDFAKLLIEMDEIGYDCEWDVLNTKEVLPQNRERVFIVCHLRRAGGRKVFPIGKGSEPSDELQRQHANCIKATYSKSAETGSYIIESEQSPQIKQIGQIYGTEKEPNPQAGRIYDSNGISPTLDTCQGGNRMPKIAVNEPTIWGGLQEHQAPRNDGISPCLTQAMGIGGGQTPIVEVKEATKKGYAVATEGDSINLEQPNSKTRRGRVGKGVAQTLTTSCNQATLDGKRIRKLTPRECFRLQGVPEHLIDRILETVSDSQAYKQAGNMVTVPVVYEIAKRIY